MNNTNEPYYNNCRGFNKKRNIANRFPNIQQSINFQKLINYYHNNLKDTL